MIKDELELIVDDGGEQAAAVIEVLAQPDLVAHPLHQPGGRLLVGRAGTKLDHPLQDHAREAIDRSELAGSITNRTWST